MAHVNPNKCLLVFALLLVGGTAFAVPPRSFTPRQPAWYNPFPTPEEKPVGCSVTSSTPLTVTYLDPDAFVYALEKTVSAWCTYPQPTASGEYMPAADGVSSYYMAPGCEDAPAGSSYQKEVFLQLTQCPSGQFCYGGMCKAPPKEAGCLDSDFTGMSNPDSFSATNAPYNPQLKTAGFVKTFQGMGQDAAIVYKVDVCKSLMTAVLYEQACVAGPTGGGYAFQAQQFMVQCPSGTECQTVPVDIAQVSPSAVGPDMPAQAGACVPKPDPCFPYTDMCPGMEGCQYTPDECPNPDVCKAVNPATQYPDSTIMGQAGQWHIDSCASSDQVLHEFCKDGSPLNAVTTCPPDTACAKGLCDGQKAPEPQDVKSDCEDTDIAGANNKYGKLEVVGTIKIKGAVVATANDSCKTKKIVTQFKCNPLNEAGYSGKEFTCTGGTDCIKGKCIVPKPCVCVTRRR